MLKCGYSTMQRMVASAMLMAAALLAHGYVSNASYTWYGQHAADSVAALLKSNDGCV